MTATLAKKPATKKRIVLIGPMLPVKGGIAQHSTLLRRTLDQYADLRTISFNRLYPDWLFPGTEEDAPGYPAFREPGVEYILDGLRPQTWKAALKSIEQSRPDAVVLPWWCIYWMPFFIYLRKRLARAGIPVIVICHNVFDHERSWWKTPLVRSALNGVDMFVVHTHSDAAIIERLLPGTRTLIHPHPVQQHFPLPSGEKRPSDSFELLFFGFVRPYKGLELLIDAMGELKGRAIRLTVVGEFWIDVKRFQTRIDKLGISSQVSIVPRYVSEKEAADYFQQADAVVLPYKESSSSGVVPLAYHFGKPVIVTRVGGLAEWVVDGVTGYSVEPDSPTAMAQAILQLEQSRGSDMVAAIAKQRGQMTWDGMAQGIVECVDSLGERNVGGH